MNHRTTVRILVLSESARLRKQFVFHFAPASARIASHVPAHASRHLFLHTGVPDQERILCDNTPWSHFCSIPDSVLKHKAGAFAIAIDPQFDLTNSSVLHMLPVLINSHSNCAVLLIDCARLQNSGAIHRDIVMPDRELEYMRVLASVTAECDRYIDAIRTLGETGERYHLYLCLCNVKATEGWCKEGVDYHLLNSMRRDLLDYAKKRLLVYAEIPDMQDRWYLSLFVEALGCRYVNAIRTDKPKLVNV